MRPPFAMKVAGSSVLDGAAGRSVIIGAGMMASGRAVEGSATAPRLMARAAAGRLAGASQALVWSLIGISAGGGEARKRVGVGCDPSQISYAPNHSHGFP
jgi:hypothetical protein